MKCNRCGADTSVEKYDIDGFIGYLCDDCREVWDEMAES